MLSALRYPYHYSNQSHGYPTQISPRGRYLAALAEARAAEEELIAEEIQREEELAEELALKRRLEEIHASRRYSGRTSSYHSRLGGFEINDVSPYDRQLYGHAYPTEDRLTRLRRELEEEDLRAARQRKQERETEALIRKEMREAEIVALRRKEEENRLALIRHQREQEEKRLLELQRAQKVAEAQRSTVTPLCNRFYSNPARRVERDHLASVGLNTLLKHIAGPQLEPDVVLRPSVRSQPPTSTPRGEKKLPAATATDTESLENFLKLVFGASSETLRNQKNQAVPASTIKPVITPDTNKATDSESAFNPEDFFKLVFGLGSKVMKAPQQSGTSSTYASSSKVDIPVSGSPKGTLPAQSDIKMANPSPQRPASPSTTLKDQLEARLNNDHQTEIRDTIQAILASLQDAATYEQAAVSKAMASSSSSASSAAGSSSKGKEKAAESQPKSESEATSMDVLKSMDTVRSIEAAFSALRQDFTFPSQLDFTPPSSRPSSPTSDTLTAKLAYTSRNHPVRYYEQSLSGLLAQLDGVESFGSAEVRLKRKEVVERVEGAIEELEREVEGRWRSRVAKEEKANVVVEKAATSESDAPQLVVVEKTQGEEESSESKPSEVVASELGTQQAVVVEAASEDVKEEIIESTTVPAQKNDAEANVMLSRSTEVSTNDTIPEVDEAVSQNTVDGNTSQPVDQTSEEVPLNTAVPSESTEDVSRLSEEVVTRPSDNETLVTKEGDSHSPVVDEPPSQTITSSYPPVAPSYPPSLSASYTPAVSLSSSVATIQPYDVDVETASTSPEEDQDDAQESDSFLLSERNEESRPRPAAKNEEDVGSDWSEVEA
ncbi:hypothetical protein WG66_011724 [Moniliophthora roreri]|nr:hypothetical protein WG66_011724 [Moniliophthora roreri]